MDLHPVLVHFPIALLTVYAGIEVVRFPKLVKQTWWLPLKSAFVILGSLASLFTFITGWLLKQAAEKTGSLSPVMAAHFHFALYTVIVFGVLAVAHVIGLTKQYWAKSIIDCAEFVLRPYVAIPLALLGLFCITATGALGAAMVYGPNIDPAVQFFYNLFVGA